MAESRHSDEELVEMARNAPEGDLRAFDRLVTRHQSKVVTNCRYLSRSADDAEDLAQEVFIKAFFGLDRFEGRAAFRTWLHRIKANHCMNFLKKQEGKTHVGLDQPEVAAADELSVDPAAPRKLAADADRARIDAVLDSIPDTLRVPLILREVDRLSYQEIAEALGLGLSAVKMRIKRGREEFRRRFAGDEPHAEPQVAP